MRDKFIFADGQAFASEDSTGTISQNIWDLEEDVSVDQMIEGYVNFVCTVLTLTSGLTQGVVLSVRTDDAVGLATAKTGTNGYFEIGRIEILKTQHLAVGRGWAVPIKTDIAKKYLGAWVAAGSTALTGTFSWDIWFENTPISLGIKAIQKRSSSSFG